MRADPFGPSAGSWGVGFGFRVWGLGPLGFRVSYVCTFILHSRSAATK